MFWKCVSLRKKGLTSLHGARCTPTHARMQMLVSEGQKPPSVPATRLRVPSNRRGTHRASASALHTTSYDTHARRGALPCSTQSPCSSPFATAPEDAPADIIDFAADGITCDGLRPRMTAAQKPPRPHPLRPLGTHGACGVCARPAHAHICIISLVPCAPPPPQACARPRPARAHARARRWDAKARRREARGRTRRRGREAGPRPLRVFRGDTHDPRLRARRWRIPGDDTRAHAVPAADWTGYADTQTVADTQTDGGGHADSTQCTVVTTE